MAERTSRLVLIRHGESTWNLEQRFTGWADIGLTEAGVAQMRDSALALHRADIAIDLAYSSVLSRCIRSQWILLEAMKRIWVPQVLDWRLNERHYGALTGTFKSEAEVLYGKDVVLQWRRSYKAVPPQLDGAAATWVPIDGRYAAVPFESIPRAESLEQTVKRVRDFWLNSLRSALQSHDCVLVVGHGNSLRALIKIIECVSDDNIANVEVANGEPIVYELDDTLHPRDKKILKSTSAQRSEIL